MESTYIRSRPLKATDLDVGGVLPEVGHDEVDGRVLLPLAVARALEDAAPVVAGPEDVLVAVLAEEETEVAEGLLGDDLGELEGGGVVELHEVAAHVGDVGLRAELEEARHVVERGEDEDGEHVHPGLDVVPQPEEGRADGDVPGFVEGEMDAEF